MNKKKNIHLIDLPNHCAKHNDFSFNMNKALEECNEFCEVILKLQTKTKEGLKGITKEDAIEEFSHLILRSEIALLTLFPEMNRLQLWNNVTKYKRNKLKKLQSYFKQGKYKGGL